MPIFMLIRGWGIGRGIHIVNASVKASDGAIINREIDDVRGFRGSLINNFMASANGWSRPYGPTIFGPFRSCIYPSIFRSTRVKNAIATRIGIINRSRFIKNMSVKKRS